jgi:hypothetical protein
MQTKTLSLTRLLLVKSANVGYQSKAVCSFRATRGHLAV